MPGPRITTPKLLTNFYCCLGDHENYAWKPMPWKGIYNKVLFFDPCTGATIELARIDKGAIYPEHYHTTVQTLFLHKGVLRNGDGTLITQGTFNVIPAGEVHGPFVAEEDSVQFKYFSAAPVYLLTDGSTYIYQKDGTVTEAGTLDFAQRIKTKNFIST